MKRWVPKKKIMIPICVLLVVLLAAGIVVSNFASPAIGTVNSSSTSQKGIASTTTPNKEYNGKYVKFSYPGRYRTAGSELSGTYLEVFSLYSSDHSNITFSFGVLREELENDSGVMYRNNHPELYKKVSENAGTIVFESLQNGYERDEFIAHQGLVASIAMTAPTADAAKNDFNVVTSSFAWQ